MNKQKKCIEKINSIVEELGEAKRFLLRKKSELYLRTMLKIWEYIGINYYFTQTYPPFLIIIMDILIYNISQINAIKKKNENVPRKVEI